MLSVLSVGGCLFSDSIKACIFWQRPVYFSKHLISLQSHLSVPCWDSISINFVKEKPQMSHSLPIQATAEKLLFSFDEMPFNTKSSSVDAAFW